MYRESQTVKTNTGEVMLNRARRQAERMWTLHNASYQDPKPCVGLRAPDLP